MTAERAERRLAAIMAADVAGYSRLMGVDEQGTLHDFKAHCRELIDPAIAAHIGRPIKTTGDGLLVEFASVVEAVACALDIQQGMSERNAAVPEPRRMRFRIGINLGDVIAEGGDIHGDGVNVAARLQALAEPGAICVSRSVRDPVRDKIPAAFEDMGERRLTDVAQPVRVFRMISSLTASAPSQSTKLDLAARRRTSLRLAVVGASLLFAGFALLAYLRA